VIEHVGRPVDLYERPKDLFVARFIGSPAMNVMAGRVTAAGRATKVSFCRDVVFELPVATAEGARGSDVTVGIRPEDLHLPVSGDWVLQGSVHLVETLEQAVAIRDARGLFSRVRASDCEV